MREGEGRKQGNADVMQHDRGTQIIAALPTSFVSMIEQANPDVVAALLQAYPQLSSPILEVVQKLRGNGFARLVTSHPLHRPTPDVETTTPKDHEAEPRSAPVTAKSPTTDPARAKTIDRQKTAAWDQIATATPDERATPTEIRLPPNIVEALEQAWRDTLKTTTESEQGGNLVRGAGGGYDVRRRANDNARMFDQDDKDVGHFQTLVGQVHTHPYRDEKDQVPEQFASFSDGDFDSLMRSDAHLSLLRSGPYTFVLAKTKQFNALVSATGDEEDKLQALAKRMTATYDKAVDSVKGRFSEKIEAGVMAVCEQFHLVYYEGQGGDLTRKTKRPPT